MSLAGKEARLRRVARTVGVRVEKSRCRTPETPSYGGYWLVDADRNFVLEGAHPYAFSMTLEDVDDALAPSSDGCVLGRARDGSWVI